MKQVYLKFIGTGYKSNYQADVVITDNNKVVCKSKTYNGLLKVSLCLNKVYLIKASCLGYTIKAIVIINDNDTYYFVFPYSYINNSKVFTFLLTDQNYKNLPIEKGELLLWPNK